MADVRSLLRSERASRRIDHPQASYSATGTLGCTVCHVPLKSDVGVWNNHLKSTQHAMRAERLRLNSKAPSSRLESTSTTRESDNGSKKRKASDGEEDSRKRTRPVVSFTETVEAIDEEPSVSPPKQGSGPIEQATQTPKPATRPLQSTSPTQKIDEAEWAAFERDIAAPPFSRALTSAPSALMAAATISAAPVSAAEIAAQQREEERASGRGWREAELEAEKEDAARALEEEFDEMEGLEERVRRLREKREALRRSAHGMRLGSGGVVQDSSARRDDGDGAGEERGGRGAGAAEQSEDEDEEFDGWGFGR
ncbi:MAG: hypothetical protein Q9217_004627 [Psora testacea]